MSELPIQYVIEFISSQIDEQLASVHVIIQLLSSIKPLGWRETNLIWAEYTLMGANSPHRRDS